jgi:hypothetical protein
MPSAPLFSHLTNPELRRYRRWSDTPGTYSRSVRAERVLGEMETEMPGSETESIREEEEEDELEYSMKWMR